MTCKYQQVGLTRDRLDPDHSLSRLEVWLSEGDILDHNTEMRKQQAVFMGMFVILENYFLDKLALCFEWMPKVVDYAHEYFFGDWREKVPSGNSQKEPPSREYQDIHCPWDTEIQSTLTWCACLNDWQRAQEIATYLRDDIKLDIDQKPENRAWLLYLGGILTGRAESEMAELATCIENGKPKREKLLFALLQAILHGTDADRDKAAKQYFKYYKSSESKSQKLTSKVAMDGTFLVHFAKHRGREIPVPENVQVHIIPQA